MRSHLQSLTVAALAVTAAADVCSGSNTTKLLTDIDQISRNWGQISPYRDNPDNLFGVNYVGLPDGCQLEQAHSLQRHAQRFPTGFFDDGINNANFAAKVANFTAANPGAKFTGPLAFLSTYRYDLGSSYLTGLGASTEFMSGVQFWNRYGRTLYNASVGQVAYNASNTNGTARPKPVLRTTGQSRIENSQISWALGFFGPSFQLVPDPKLAAFANGSLFDVVVIPEGGTTAYIDMSDFCNLFTLDEWEGFEQTLDIEYYYDYAWGNPTGRAQGLGYLQELIARLTKQYITSSNSSVNSTITNNARDFPLGRPFYADFTHDDIIVSTLTAMSMDYFKDPPSLNEVPPNPDRHFILNQLTPFGARMVTEVIGCASPNPDPVRNHRTYYSPGQYGYSPSNATHKFIRIRLNNGIAPINSIRGGACIGRSDGLCPLDKFLQSQQNAGALANYQFACFANYTLANPTNAQDYDGTVSNTTAGVTIHPGMLTAAYFES